MDKDSLVGTLFAGRFQILSLLGSGGMGSVYLARHEVLQRQVALKVIRKDLLEDVNIARRFRREARAASRIEHPNIMDIFDFGQATDGRLYLAMEYVEGPTLHQVLKEAEVFRVPRLLWIMGQISDALVAAHASNVIHRDLKPNNILITTAKGQIDHVKILDFGLAKIVGLQATAALSVHGKIFGTPEYMSPERCMDKEVDLRSDIYSLGILAWEMLVGRVPFSGRLVQTLSAHVSVKPDPPSKQSSQPIDARVDALVMSCLVKEPGERPTALELLKEIKRLRKGSSYPPSDRTPPPITSEYRRVTSGIFSEAAAKTQPLMDSIEISTDELQVSDTEISMNPILDVQPTLPGGDDSLALEELAYALRDRGLGPPEVTDTLAFLVEVSDRMLVIESTLESLERTAQNLEMTARIRESRLSQVLHQLEHELYQIGDKDPKYARKLTGHIKGVSSRIQKITEENASQHNILVERTQVQQQNLAQVQAAVTQRATQLKDLLRRVKRQINRMDAELSALFSRAGL